MDVVDVLDADPILFPLTFGALGLAVMGLLNVLSAVHWARRRRLGQMPKPMTIWTMQNVTPHFPVFGYVAGAVFLTGAVIVFVVIVVRLLT